MGLILHCGANHVERRDLSTCATPAATRTWHPVPHFDFVMEVQDALTEHKLAVISEAHGLWGNGLRYFGFLELHHDASDYGLVVGLRNSHDKSFAAGLALGTNVFCCDNLAFSGDVTINRKHTSFVERDLPAMITEAIGKLSAKRARQDEMVAAYKDYDLSDQAAHDLIIKLVDNKIITPSSIMSVVREWRTPRHEEFQPRNAWSLFNGVTEVLKGSSLAQLPSRTSRMHGLLNLEVGLAA